MKHTESLTEFYRERSIRLAENLEYDTAHYGVFTLEENGFGSTKPARYCRRNFYKIALIRGENRCHYAEKSLTISGSTLLFFTPTVPYTWEPLSIETGYFCIFKEAFITEGLRGGLRQFPMLAPGGKVAYQLSAAEDEQISLVFQKMIKENQSTYSLKLDLARTYLMELLHLALKMEPCELLYQHTNANSRLYSIFVELLERQFPIESMARPFGLRSATTIADHLCIHVNHLNRAVRETSGKTTTEYIAERLMAEARALLRFTDWNIAEIGYSLGFEESAHFYNFFKKQAGSSPSAWRKAVTPT